MNVTTTLIEFSAKCDENIGGVEVGSGRIKKLETKWASLKRRGAMKISTKNKSEAKNLKSESNLI